MSQAKALDMTQGPIAKTLIRFSLPLVASGLLQQLYGWADALIVGNVVGEGPLAAVGATSTVSGLIIFVLAGFSVGVSVPIAQAFGRGERESLPKITGTFVAVIALMSLLLSALGFALAGPLLRLLDTPGDILGLSLDYLRIIFVGVPFLAVYNISSAALRGVGDSRTPLISVALSAAANIALDLLFVAVLGWGVRGAAWATVLSQAVMAVFVLSYIHRRIPLLAFRWGRGMIDRPALRQGLRLALPSAIQQAVRSGGSMMLQSVQNGFGTVVVAAISSAYRIDTVALMPVINIGSGVSTFAGQNFGAGNLPRARRGLATSAAMAFGVATVIIAIIVPLGGKILALFGISPQAVRIGWDFLRLCTLFYPLFGLQSALTGYLVGLGDVYFVSGLHTAALAVRIGVSYAMRGAWGHRVIAYAEIISWLFTLAIAFARYRLRFSKNARPRVVPEEKSPSP